MVLYLYQNDSSFAAPYMIRLQGRLKDAADILEAAEIRPLTPCDENPSAPRVVAVLETEDANHEAILRAAVDSLKNPNFKVLTDLPEEPPLMTARDPLVGLMQLLPGVAEMSDADQAFLMGAVNEEADSLEAVLLAEPTGIDFPELSYEGKQKKAYDAIVKALKMIPHEDRGNYLKPSSIRAVKRPRTIARKDWDPVVEHLEREVLIFLLAREWLGDSGHLQMTDDRQRIVNFAFLEDLDRKYLGLGGNHMLDLQISTMFELSFIALGAAAPAAGPVKAGLSAIWKLAQGSMPDPEARVRCKIKELQDELLTLWVGQMDVLGAAHKKINHDWGLMDRFGKLFEEQKMQWPEEIGPVRRALTSAYQIYALQQTVSIAPEGGKYVLRREEKSHAGKRAKAAWIRDNQGQNWGSATKDYKSGPWFFRTFLGSRHHDPLSRTTSYLQAGRPLQKKLFGTDQSSETDPELAFHYKFLTDPKSAMRDGWGLTQMNI